jgi:hypothetical protein
MKLIVLLIITLLNFSIFSQINVGTKDIPVLKPGKFDQSQLDDLKKSKTLFIYRTHDKEYLDTFKNTLKNVWNYSDIEFISYDEFLSNKYDENYSFFSIGARMELGDMNHSDSFYSYLNLWKNIDGKKTLYCRINLFPTFEAFYVCKKNFSKEEVFLKYMYEEAEIHNWNIVYLKNALQFVNDKLSKSETYSLMNNVQDKDLSPLKNDTLYIPDYVLIKFDQYQINGSHESSRLNKEDLLKDYPHPYRIVSINELSKIISNSAQPIYYLSCIRNPPGKYLTVINSRTGEFLYSVFSTIGFNFSSSDFARLARLIKK